MGVTVIGHVCLGIHDRSAGGGDVIPSSPYPVECKTVATFPINNLC